MNLYNTKNKIIILILEEKNGTTKWLKLKTVAFLQGFLKKNCFFCESKTSIIPKYIYNLFKKKTKQTR